MTIWAIADIHASPLDPSGEPQKPMELFGSNWEGHVDRIEEAWKASVGPGDTVLIAGDLDWALRLEDAVPTLMRVDAWPGNKLLVRGNHDYWWSSKSTNKVRAVLPPSIQLIHNNAYQVEGFNIVGAKGSPVPGGIEWSDVDAKLLHRETERLKLSMAARKPNLPTIAVLHYPPFYPASGGSLYVELFKETQVCVCVYGHLHGNSAESGPRGQIEGMEYVLAAADYRNFRPVKVAKAGRICRSSSREPGTAG